MLAGKTVLLCVSGSIAAYKIAYLASALKKTEGRCPCAYDPECDKFHQPDYIRDTDRK